MIENKIETFSIKSCPQCGSGHFVDIDVYRDILPNDMNKDVRVPEFHKVAVNLRCPDEDSTFTIDLFIQEDVYSKIVKLRRPS